MRFSRAVQATFALSLLALGVAGARKQDPPKTPQLIPAPIRIQPGTLRPAPPLWGFADLHTHPASHLGFGDRGGGGIMGGMFWGKPGMGLDSSMATLNSDMPPCAVDSHYGEETSDAVRKETRKEIIKTIDGIHGSPHGPNGAPSFRDWPHSQSLLHQQMHISAIKRAYDGGLRLMVASVTDAQ